MSISFGGLSSGLDTEAIINALLSVQQQPIDRLEEKKSDYESKVSLLSQLITKVSSLRTAAQGLDTDREFFAYSAESSDTDVATATASSTATKGVYQMTVDSLAYAERTYSDVFAERDQTGLVGSGTLSIQVGSDTPVDIPIDDSTDTLEDVAEAINDADLAVSASIMDTGSGYRLVVTGDEPGAANTLTFTEGGTLALDLDDPANQKQAATDAQITLDGSIVVTSDSNSTTDAIPGVTLTLLDETTEAITVSVDVDTDAIKGKVQEMLDAYNSMASFIKQQLTYTGEVKTDTLMGDGAVRSVKSTLQRIMFSAVEELDDPYTALARIGVSTKSDGTMELDGGDFEEALADDPTGVAALFTHSDGDDDTDNDGIAVTLKRTIDEMLTAGDGLLESHKAGLNTRISNLQDRIDVLELNMDTYETGLRRKYALLEQTLSSLQNQSSYLATQ